VAIEAVLFDLDDTLIEEEDSAKWALAQTCLIAAARHGLDSRRLVDLVRQHAGDLWRSVDTITYCRAVGISSWEGLWARFVGAEDPNLERLRSWAPTYRFKTWAAALNAFGIHDDTLASEVANAFPVIRNQRHVVLPGAVDILAALRPHAKLAIISNGSPDLQRQKLRRSGLQKYVDTVIVSGEVGVGKPNPAIFQCALRSLDVQASKAVMVGDSLTRDVDGAQRAGIRAVWLNRRAVRPADAKVFPDAEIRELNDLPRVLERVDRSWRSEESVMNP